MTRNKFFLAIFIIIVVVTIVLNIYQRRVRFTDLKIGSHYYHLEIADNPAKRQEGLLGKESLPKDEGMIFLFPYADRFIFTMEEMKFPIDIIWLNNGKVVDLTPNASPAELGDEILGHYIPSSSANQVIEVPAGTISKENLKIGDVIQK